MNVLLTADRGHGHRHSQFRERTRSLVERGNPNPAILGASRTRFIVTYFTVWPAFRRNRVRAFFCPAAARQTQESSLGTERALEVLFAALTPLDPDEARNEQQSALQSRYHEAKGKREQQQG